MQYTNLIWRDGQPYSELFDDIYYSSQNSEAIPGESEFNHVFFKHNNLAARWEKNNQFTIAELGFGSGLNCALTIRQWLKHCEKCNTAKTLHYIAIEKHPLSANSVAELLSPYSELQPICDEMLKSYPPAVESTHCRTLFDNKVVIHYKFMDIKQALDDDRLNVDAWYLDGFSPAKNPDMWSADVFKQMAVNSADGATCSTYTSAGFVKRNLDKSGFEVSKVTGHGKKREMLVATLKKNLMSALFYKDKPWFVSAPKFNSRVKKITIIGAGIAGLTVAYSMVKRGWSVTIIDKHGDIARESSSNPAAIVYPRLSVNSELDTRFYISAYCYALYVLHLLQERSAKKFWFDSGLQQAFDKKRIMEIIKRFQFNKDFMEVSEAKHAETPKVMNGKVLLEYKNAGVVLPNILCRVIREYCADALTIVQGDVDTISYENDKWSCFSKSGLIDETECLVVANGNAINALGISLEISVESIRGQALVLNEKPMSESIKKTVNADVYFTPVVAGKHYLGATYSQSNKSTDVDVKESQNLLESLQKIYPDSFTSADVKESWVGFRCMSNDRVPVVGALADLKFFDKQYADIQHGKSNKKYLSARYKKGLYITAAHGSRGFTSSFLCAEVIASQLAGEPSPVNKKTLDYLNPSRFAVNKLKRR